MYDCSKSKPFQEKLIIDKEIKKKNLKLFVLLIPFEKLLVSPTV